MALRLAYPFNSDIAKGLNVSLDSVGRVQGLGELTGLVTLGVGRQLDRGHYRRWVLVGISMAGVGSLLIGVGNRLWVFGLCFALIACGVAVMTTAAQTWIGETVPYAERGRIVGIYEASWALALLLGAPLAGFLIDRGSWWWPFVVVGVFTIAIVPLVGRALPRRTKHSSGQEHQPVKVAWDRRIFGAIAASSLLTIGASVVFSSYGAWLKDRHGFTTATLSVLTIGLGVMELLGSGSVAAFADRLGKRKSVALGALIMASAGVMLVTAKHVTPIAAVGVVLFFGGFEFGYVAQISINSEVGGAARGRVMAINGSIVTAARALGAALGTWMYVHLGFVTVSIVSVACALTTAALTYALID
jgi:predicted MFS family arabinose efflux permease